jgi:MoaA/NifB/PqqE/SkfB family radical SAM enzyme
MSKIEQNLILSSFRFNNSKNCCLAPHSTINFDSTGKMKVCCYNEKFILGTYPATSLKQAWNTEAKQPFIKALERRQFPAGCSQCRAQILQHNEKNALFASYDWTDNYLEDHYPIAMKFEFGTICNYECIMCGGKWSSSIRKNREKLPSLKHPYDDSFVEQLKEFIPFLKIGSFLGGEPFLNPIYYKIWDAMLELNPDIALHITTNGSIYSSKIENYLKKFKNVSVTISLDSLDCKTYSFIRKNGNLTTVLENLQKFKKLGMLNGIAFCPMIQNIFELPHIIHFCIIIEL